MSSGIVLLTGGSGVLGHAIVAALRRAGRGVAFTYHRNPEAAARLALESGSRAYALDLEDPASPDRLAREVENELGPLEGLVNNVGIRADGLLAMTSDDDWQRVIDLNLGGLFRCCRAVVPGMVRRHAGAIVNVASLSAVRGLAGQAAYAASKAGVLGLTRSLAREVGRRGIRVNAVAPGYIASSMTASVPEATIRALRAHECLPAGVDATSVGETVAFLLSPAAASITGQCIVVDAGASI